MFVCFSKIVSEALLEELVEVIVEEYVENVREHVQVLNEVVDHITKQSCFARSQIVHVEEEYANQLRKTTKEGDDDAQNDHHICFALHRGHLLFLFPTGLVVVHLFHLFHVFSFLAEIALDTTN